MPAPLGRSPTRKMPKIQVFGLEDSQSTRAAIRFFRERRIVVTYVDLRKNPIAPAELRRFVEVLGTDALIEPGGAATAAGAAGGGLLAMVRADARTLRLPLVRYGQRLTAGRDEATWRNWLVSRGG